MLGPLINSAALAIGGIFGASLGRFVSKRVKETLPLVCGIISVGIGAVLMTKVHAMPAVALALLAGTLIGELLHLEQGLERCVKWVQARLGRMIHADRDHSAGDAFVLKYVTIMVLFCASGMGIFGATHEGMTGDPNILLAKAVLDLFTAMIFATELGFSVALIAFPQILIQGVLFFSAHLLIPLASPAMLADFSACGGIIMLATGMRICSIKVFPIVNMLPALLLIMPVSVLWARLFV